MTYVVTLYPVSIATAVIVKNNGVKPVTLTSAILSHLKFKYRAKSAIQGLRACTYCTHPPLSSPFEIITPDEAMKPDSPGLFDFFFEPEEKPVLNHRLSRIYAAPPEERLKRFYNTPPSKFETLDQVINNSSTYGSLIFPFLPSHGSLISMYYYAGKGVVLQGD
ncbi:hypothetical protein LINPERPRIM_LOCUS39489 [Linum perenne]